MKVIPQPAKPDCQHGKHTHWNCEKARAECGHGVVTQVCVDCGFVKVLPCELCRSEDLAWTRTSKKPRDEQAVANWLPALGIQV